MKRCPSCQKTFDDAMRFCQVDGTPLVDDAPPLDPYKTMVARPEDIAAAMPPAAEEKREEPPAPEPASEGEVLQIPESDPKKTMYASEDEIRSAMADVDKQVIDIPPAAEPEPPRFIESDLPQSGGDAPQPVASKTTPPIPSPFGQVSDYKIGQPEEFNAPDPEPPSFVQPEAPTPGISPFDDQAPAASAPLQQAEFDPTPAASSDRPNQQMQNPQYQPGSGLPAASQSKMLAILSLVFGILGFTLCCGTVLPSLVAIVLGFMARGKASSDPMNYGGSGLAIGGIITGLIGLLASIAYLVFVFFLGGMELIMREMPR